jgi:hypothetical protein
MEGKTKDQAVDFLKHIEKGLKSSQRKWTIGDEGLDWKIRESYIFAMGIAAE